MNWSFKGSRNYAKATSLAVCARRMFCDKNFIFTLGPDQEQSINLFNHKAVLL